jgi:hydroxylamine reductase (hybrid-cluster protein)
MMFVLKYILDNYISDSEAKTQAQEKICQVARLREESKLKHIAHMHKIEEEREKDEQRNAEARADIKRKRDAADLEEVSHLHLSYMKKIIALLYYYFFLKIIRNGAEKNLRRITIERFKKLSKRKKKLD